DGAGSPASSEAAVPCRLRSEDACHGYDRSPSCFASPQRGGAMTPKRTEAPPARPRRRNNMRTDTSLHALRDASPRNQPGFDDWIDSFDSLRTQIPATPVPARRPLPKPKSRHRPAAGLGVTRAAGVAASGVVVGLALTAASPPGAEAAARRALAATA